MPRTHRKERIAILGGGLGGLSTAFELTRHPGWQDRYEVTVYQSGWRLGGKCASSRNPDQHNRIEEHGPHVWCGCYDNAFSMMRDCYDELGRPPGHRFRDIDTAFRPEDGGAVLDRVGSRWDSWPLRPGDNSASPGGDSMLPPVVDVVGMLLGFALDTILHDSGGPAVDGGPAPANRAAGLPGLLRAAEASLLALSRHGWKRISRGLPTESLPPVVGRLAGSLRTARSQLATRIEARSQQDPAFRRSWILADGALCIALGLVSDGLLGADLGALDAIDDEEWSAWLRRHGATDATLSSGLVREVYDLCFSFRTGDPDQPDFAAGAALRTLVRVLFTYKGAVLYTMRAGMGEIAIAPLYQVLARRGVRFRFFHHVDGLGLSTDKRDIERIRIRRQAGPSSGLYEPLVDVDGVACWPHQPHWDQLVEGKALARSGVDLESVRSPWKTVEQVELRRGRDFDRVVLAIALGALPSICGELTAARPRWRAMLEGVPTVATQVGFVWLRPDLAGLGWQGGNAFIGAYAAPFSNWGDWSHLLPEEGWQGADGPRSLAYVCGPLPEPVAGPDQRAAQDSVVRGNLADWLDQHGAGLWPGTAVGGAGGFDWDVLFDPKGRVGRARVASQYVRANTEPTERFVLACAGTVRLRMQAGDSGFGNLVLAGDWVLNGLNAACVEATVMSGRQAARALGAPVGPIVGELNCAP